MNSNHKAKTAILGGSFSPIHTGHIAVARGIVSAGLAEEVWLTPCRRNPLKDGTTTLPDEVRLQQIRKAIAYCLMNNPEEAAPKLNDIELSMPMPSYTCDTLRKMQQLYPDRDFRIAMGADSYLNFTKWKDWEWIEQNFSPIVYPRPGYPLEECEIRPRWTLLRGVNEIDISSSELRNIMSEGYTDTEFMPWMNVNC